MNSRANLRLFDQSLGAHVKAVLGDARWDGESGHVVNSYAIFLQLAEYVFAMFFHHDDHCDQHALERCQNVVVEDAPFGWF